MRGFVSWCCLCLAATPVLADSDLRWLNGHTSTISALAVSPDGRTLASASTLGPVRLWDLATGSERRAISAELTGVFGLAFSPDGHYLATTGESRVRIYDATRAYAWVRDLPAGSQRQVAVAFSPDSKQLAAGGYDGITRIWTVGTGDARATFAPATDRVTTLAFSPDGKMLAVGGCGLMRANAGFALPVLAADFVRLFAADTAKLLHELPVRGSQLCFSSDGKTLYANGTDITSDGGQIGGRAMLIVNGQAISPTERLHAIDLGTLRSKLVVTRQGGLVALSPDGRMLAYGGRDELHFSTNRGGFLALGRGSTVSVQVRERASNSVAAEGASRLASAIVWSPDNQHLIFGQGNGTIGIWLWAGSVPPAPAMGWSESELNQLWSELSGAEGPTALRAVNKLVSTPAQSVRWFGEQLHAVQTIDGSQVRQWLTELDHPRYRVRIAAFRALGKLGSQVRPALQLALTPAPSAEVRWRVEALLQQIEDNQLSADELRQLRAVLVLERVGDPTALALLQEFSRGAPAAYLTQAAQAALHRLRPPAPARTNAAPRSE